MPRSRSQSGRPAPFVAVIAFELHLDASAGRPHVISPNASEPASDPPGLRASWLPTTTPRSSSCILEVFGRSVAPWRRLEWRANSRCRGGPRDVVSSGCTGWAKVKALDFSPVMIDALRRRASAEGVVGNRGREEASAVRRADIENAASNASVAIRRPGPGVS